MPRVLGSPCRFQSAFDKFSVMEGYYIAVRSKQIGETLLRLKDTFETVEKVPITEPAHYKFPLPVFLSTFRKLSFFSS